MENEILDQQKVLKIANIQLKNIRYIMDRSENVFKQRFGKFWCVYRGDESNAVGVFDHEQDANKFLTKIKLHL